MISNRTKITVELTAHQLAAAEEACDAYADGDLIEIPSRQRAATVRAANNLRRAFKESGAFWPW